MSLFQSTLEKAASSGVVTTNTRQSMNWLKANAEKFRASATPRKILGQAGEKNIRNGITIGRLYMFLYDPKTKNDLPYWDKFPLVFPFEKAPGGFMGLNMHYLPPTLRAKLFDALTEQVSNARGDDTTRLRLNYRILKSVSSIKYYQPCIKRYLNGHVRSRFVYIEPSDWTVAMFLPSEQFQKATAQKVWSDSRRSAF